MARTARYRIAKRVVERSQPTKRGFTKQVVVWDVIAPNGEIVRTFKRHDWAQREIERRKQRVTSLKKAADEARRTGNVVEVRKSGRATVKVSFMPGAHSAGGNRLGTG